MRKLLLLIGSVISLVASAGERTPSAIFTKDATVVELGPCVGIFLDTSGTMTPEMVWATGRFEPFTGDVPNLPPLKSPYWLGFKAVNLSNEPDLFLSIPYADIDEIDVYIVGAEFVERIAHSGRSVEMIDRLGAGATFDFKIPVPTNSSARVLLRVRGFKTMHLPLQLAGYGHSPRVRAERNLMIGAYAGVLLVMALYNLFVFFSIRDRAYLLYVLYILAICCAQMSYLGLGPFDLWEGSAWLNSRSSLLFSIVAIILGMEFQRRFIGTAHFSPKLHRIYPYVYGLVAVIMGVYLFGDPWIGFNLGNAMCGLTAVIVLTTAISSFRSGSRQAGFFLLAWTVFLLGVVVFVLKDAGVMSYNQFTAHVMPIGSAIEGVLLSFGLADRINVLRREKEASQAAALHASLENERIIREQNVILEDKVQERTQALLRTNEDLKLTQTQLVSAEKMASLGQLTAGIAHEINNPINFITSNIPPLRRNIGEIVEMMQGYRSMDPSRADFDMSALKEKDKALGIQESIDELDDIISSIAEGSNRTAEIVRGLRNFSRLDEADLNEADLNDGLRSTLAILTPRFRDKVKVTLDLGEIPKVECYPGKVNQVFMNILTNAVQASLERTDGCGPEIHVSTRSIGDHVQVCIRDNGMGMSDEVKTRMYDPFFTTKPVGEGTGLGLAIVYGIIQDHRGEISVESSIGTGSEFRFQFPLYQGRINDKAA